MYRVIEIMEWVPVIGVPFALWREEYGDGDGAMYRHPWSSGAVHAVGFWVLGILILLQRTN